MSIRLTPVATRLSEVKMLAGGEFKLVVANMAFAGLAIVMLHVWQYLPVPLAVHGALVMAARHDPRLREIYLAYARQGDEYLAWPATRLQRYNRRPHGFARHGQC